jgi:serpin B
MLNEGVEGKTKKELNNFIKEKELKDLTNFKIELANSLWIDDFVKDTNMLNEKYKETILKKYEAFSDCIDLQSEEIFKINDWINEKTHGLIPKVFNEPLDNADLILVNTLYFKDNWLFPFNEIGKKNFSSSNNKNIVTDFISNTDLGSFYESNDAIAFSSPYENGLEFIGILPKNYDKNNDFNLSDIDLEELLKTRKYHSNIYVEMPKLDIEFDASLTNILKENYMPSIFQTNNDDLDYILSKEYRDEWYVYVSDILQNCKLKLDENGTEAAAVTSIIMDCENAIMMPEEQLDIILDRPFAFMIYDSQNENIIFIGKVIEP